MESCRLAVIGAGLIGAKHAALVRAHDLCRLVGISDTDPGRRAVAEQLGVPFYHSVEELLESKRPDGAIIATPNARHAPVAVACTRRGVHVLVEKPIADTLQSARSIIDAAGESGISVLVGHHRRHNPLVAKARELVRGGALGRLVGVSALWTLLKPDDYFRVAWRREHPGGGPLLINLIHDLDSLRFICGDVASVYANCSSAARGYEVEDSLAISLSFESGALGTFLASDATPAVWSYEATTAENPLYYHVPENCYHFVGTAASLAFPRMELWRYAQENGRGWDHPLQSERLEVAGADPLVAQLAHFCRVIRGQEAPVIGAEEAAQSLALALAVRQSAARGSAVCPAEMMATEAEEHRPSV